MRPGWPSVHAKARWVCAILGCTALAVVGIGGFVFREDLWWWWKLRPARWVRIVDGFVGEHLLRGSSAAQKAGAATRRFIGSLEEEAPKEIEVLGYLSEVNFLPPGEGQDSVLKVWLTPKTDPEHAGVAFLERRYSCTPRQWLGYLRELLRPLKAELVGTWRGKGTGGEGRWDVASAVALVAPETEGLTECLVRALEKEHLQALLFLWELGPRARSAVPALEALIGNSDVDEDARAAAKESLARILGAAP